MTKKLKQDEYFRLEAHDAKATEIELGKKLLEKDKVILGQELTILKLRMEKLSQELRLVQDQIQTEVIKLRNVHVAKDAIKLEIKDRLKLKSGEFGFNPDTLEIIP